MCFSSPYPLRTSLLLAALIWVPASVGQVDAQQTGSQQAPNQQKRPTQPSATPKTPAVTPGTRGFKTTLTLESILRQQEAASEAKAGSSSRATPGKNGVPATAARPSQKAGAPAVQVRVTESWWMSLFSRLSVQPTATPPQPNAPRTGNSSITIRVQTPPAPRKP